MSLNEINIDELMKMLDEFKPPERERRVSMYIGNMLIGKAVDFTYNVTREHRPIFQMGNPDPRQFGPRITGDVIGLRTTKEGEDYLHRVLRSTLDVTFEIESARRGYEDVTIEIPDFAVRDFRISRVANEWTLHYRANHINQYETPKNNKQAAKLLLKR